MQIEDNEGVISYRKRIASVGLSIWHSQRFFYVFCAVLVIAILAGAYVAYGNINPNLPIPRYQHVFNTCNSAACHASPATSAKIYIGLDGVDVTDDPVAAIAPNDALEIDFHFEGLGQSGKSASAVGAQITLPDDPGWTINRGTPAHPDDWGPNGQGRSYWSASWDQTASGGGRQLVKWTPSLDRPNVYYANFAGAAWSKGLEPALAADSGNRDDGDLDGQTRHMGIDAFIGVPLKAKVGEYQIEVAGIGRDSEGKPASISKKIVVRVLDPSDPALAGKTRKKADEVGLSFAEFVPPAAPTPNVTPTPTPERLEDVYARRDAPKPWPSPPVEEPATIHGGQNCKSCHDSFDVAPAVRALPVDHKGRAEGTCRLCHMRPNMGPYNGTGEWHYIVPRIPHDIVGRDDCLSCHKRPGGVKPVSSTHAGRTSDICRGCHQLPSSAGGPPPLSHTLEGRSDCLSCHGPGSTVPAPADHKTRHNDVCRVCHIPSENGPTGLTGYAVPIPHTLDRHADCARCHQVFNDPTPTPTPVPAPTRVPARSAR